MIAKTNRQTLSYNSILLALIIIISLLTSPILVVADAYRNITHKKQQINLGIYPWVPRIDQFRKVIEEKWKNIEPNIEINFVTDEIWDGGYGHDPSDDLDVFVFDAIYLDYFVKKGFLDPIHENEIDNINDILEYARSGVRKNGQYFGIPQLGCGSILFFRKMDNGIKNANSLSEIAKVIGQCPYAGENPPLNKGLMIDMSGGTTNYCFYIESVEDIYGKYSPNPPMPLTNDHINPWAISNLHTVFRMTNRKHANSYSVKRSELFSKGFGRALIGYTESMSSMSKDALKNIEFKLMPFSNREDVHLFYSDVIGINPKVNDKGMKNIALKLANMLATTDVMVNSIKGSENRLPQYLLPVRTSIFESLSKEYPIYSRLHDLVKNNNPKLFRLGPNSKALVKQMKNAIKKEIFSDNVCK